MSHAWSRTFCRLKLVSCDECKFSHSSSQRHPAHQRSPLAATIPGKSSQSRITISQVQKRCRHRTLCTLASTGLLCLANAKEGGDSSWSSSVAVHNEMVRRAPRLARELARRGIWYFDRKGEIPDRSDGLVRPMGIAAFQGSLSRAPVPQDTTVIWGGPRSLYIGSIESPSHFDNAVGMPSRVPRRV